MLIFFRILQFSILYGGGAFLCYAPFRDRLHDTMRKTVMGFFLLFCVVLAIYLCFLCLVSDQAAHMWFLAVIPLMGFFYIWSIKENPYKTVLILLLTGCYAAFLSGCSVLLAKVIFGSGMGYEFLYTVTFLFIGGATYYLIYEFMSLRIVPIVNLMSSNDLRSVYFVPLFFIVLQAVFFTLYDTLGQMSDLLYFIVLVALDMSTYFVVMDIIHLLDSTLDNRRMKEEISTAEKLLELQKSQYASWVTQIEAVRRARHDLKHHIAMISTFLDQDDKEGLQEYVRDFQRILPENAPMMLCRNMDVNAILLHYYDRARKENVRLELYANVEETIAINSQDLAVVFGNCLENAFEACARMAPTAEKSVSLMAKPIGKGLAIVIDNTFDGQALKENGIYLSSKREHQAGIGMASVKLVVEKYSGIASFETEGNFFLTSIRLGSKKNAKGTAEYES